MAKVEAVSYEKSGKAGKTYSLEMLKNFYNAVAESKAKQKTAPSIYGYGFNNGAASVAGFQALLEKPVVESVGSLPAPEGCKDICKA